MAKVRRAEPKLETRPPAATPTLGELARLGQHPTIRDAFQHALKFALAGETIIFPRVEPSAAATFAALLRQTDAAQGLRIWLMPEGIRHAEEAFDQLLPLDPGTLLVPEPPGVLVEGAPLDPELVAEQLEVAQQLRRSRTAGLLAVATAAAWETDLPDVGDHRASGLVIRRGDRLDPGTVAAQLAAAGFERVPQVSERRQFAVRGGILDVFSTQHRAPARLEFFGDEVESVREFDLHEQVSQRDLAACELLLVPAETAPGSSPAAQADNDDVIIHAGPQTLSLARGRIPVPEGATRAEEGLSLFDLAPRADGWWRDDETGREAGRRRVQSQLQFWARDGVELVLGLAQHTEAELREEFGEVLAGATVRYVPGVFPNAVMLRELKTALLPAGLLFGHRRHLAVGARPNWLARRATSIRRAAVEDAATFDAGDLVVHEEHGIARFHGLEPDPEDPSRSRLVLEFEGGARLFMPLEQSHLVGRYQGLGKRRPNLSRLGEARWAGALRSARTATAEYATRLLRLQALREAGTGTAFPPDGEWQKGFEETFPYHETPDQVRAIAETKHDMESRRPMDRLICGDVGFGKTEVAIRAAFKAAAAGRQVALMVPTTVLAQQHFSNWKRRFADFPIRLEMLSRYRSPREQRDTIRDLGRGAVDVVIGTHRLISEDVSFRDLALLIVDEEQRFGVKHKERLKERYPMVDILTLSATPIPRTLYMALTGARDMSVLETPPPSRFPVETAIVAFDERIIRNAIDRERAREGQVFVLHNRIATIERLACRIRELCPGARVEVGHGQMDEEQLDAVMTRFVEGETDVLVSTTIIESGIDIPNANTIIIDRADRFGLADLYQLRGRVGRGTHRAYAWLMLPRELITVGAARKRIEAIRQYSSLGAGFQIAMRDLEIRGAGNLLGLSQSGHITAVGFHLYCEMLEQAVAALRGQPVRRRPELTLTLDFVSQRESDTRPGTLPAWLPLAYVDEDRQRMEIFRKLAAVASPEDVKTLRAQLRDRYGRLPEPAENLLALAGLRATAAAKGITTLTVRDDKLILERGGEPIQIEGRFPRLTSTEIKPRFREVLANIRAL